MSGLHDIMPAEGECICEFYSCTIHVDCPVHGDNPTHPHSPSTDDLDLDGLEAADRKPGLGDTVTMPDGTWKIVHFHDEPNTGMCVLEAVEPPRGKNIALPFTWVLAAMTKVKS